MRGIAHIGIAVGLVATHCAFASVWYVNKASTSTTENGRTWGTAFKTIQPAIDAASNDGGGEVWVAKGIYDEARVSPDTLAGVNTGTLLIRAATSIYGGFSGNETDIAGRNWSSSPTIIDGSTSRDGANAYHVVEMSSNTVLDGITIRGGNANGGRARFTMGGGMTVTGKRVAVENCTFDRNFAQVDGGGVLTESGSSEVKFSGCQFLGNGVAVSVSGSPSFAGCSFRGNNVAFRIPAGLPTISGCEFRDNERAIILDLNGSVRVYNSTFSGNHAKSSGAAIRAIGLYICDEGCSYTNSVMIFGCTFYNNTATHGGAIWSETTPMWVENSIFWSNSPESIYFGPNHYTGTSVDFKNCIVQGGFAVGVNILDQDPLFVNPTKGDFRLMPSSPAIDSGENLDYLAPLFPLRFPLMAVDIEGAPRPQLAGYDMGAYEYPPSPTPDVDGNGQTDAVDIQVAINSALGLATDYLGDINHDGASDAVDIQLVINAALNL